jgi:putative transposon-encoded protein
MGTTYNTKKGSPTIMLDREKKILKCWIRSAGNSGRIIVPKDWVGKIAFVQIIEEDLEAKNKN